MNENEQIEELRKVVKQIVEDYAALCRGRRCGECPLYFAKPDCRFQFYAIALFKAGHYRVNNVEDWKKNFESLYEATKAALRTEIARDIVEVIEAAIEEFYPSPWHKGYHDAQLDMVRHIKKHYLEVQDENS